MNDAIVNLALFGVIILPILATEFWFYWWLFGAAKSRISDETERRT